MVTLGINFFGFGESNVHMLLKWNTKQKVNNGAASDGIANHSTDAEYIRLIHDIHSDNIDGHPWRGYIVLDTLQQNSIREIQNNQNIKRPVCFVFSALGTQWPKMGQNLLKFDAFANAIKICDIILKPYNINIINILTKQYGCESALHA